MQTKLIRLIVGLGNPGATYKNTYHNAGILFTEYATRSKHRDLIGSATVLASTSSMNESGRFVREAMQRLGVKPEEIMIAHDDSDLPLGSIKISFGKGSAGHHGVESVIAWLTTDHFTRLRIGIRPREETIRSKAGSFVLKKMSRDAKQILEAAFHDALTKIQTRSTGTIT